jgi:hypothetical protein
MRSKLWSNEDAIEADEVYGTDDTYGIDNSYLFGEVY